VDWEAGVGQVLQQGAEGLAATAGDRQGADVAERRTPRGGERFQVGPQPVRDVVRQPGVDVGGPVAAGLERQAGSGVCAAFFGEQPLVLGLVGELWGEVLQDPTAELSPWTAYTSSMCASTSRRHVSTATTSSARSSAPTCGRRSAASSATGRRQVLPNSSEASS
jgi:hypothetical protein